MTEPTPSRPVPGPPQPGPGSEPAERPDHDAPEAAATEAEDRFADLEARPVAEHVDVFEAEHGRLERELGTIDRL
jgi:hypothetical protein